MDQKTVDFICILIKTSFLKKLEISNSSCSDIFQLARSLGGAEALHELEREIFNINKKQNNESI
jgi:hypothetical protein